MGRDAHKRNVIPDPQFFEDLTLHIPHSFAVCADLREYIARHAAVCALLFGDAHGLNIEHLCSRKLARLVAQAPGKHVNEHIRNQQDLFRRCENGRHMLLHAAQHIHGVDLIAQNTGAVKHFPALGIVEFGKLFRAERVAVAESVGEYIPPFIQQHEVDAPGTYADAVYARFPARLAQAALEHGKDPQHIPVEILSYLDGLVWFREDRFAFHRPAVIPAQQHTHRAVADIKGQKIQRFVHMVSPLYSALRLRTTTANSSSTPYSAMTT